MEIKQYLDSTYLKTAAQANVSESENENIVRKMVTEAIEEGFKLIMIRPEYVSAAKQMIKNADSNVTVGTVIDFPEGSASIDEKLKEAAKAIADGADELDFVCNYQAFLKGDTDIVREEVSKCTKFCLEHLKVAKWIIEVAALNNMEIAQLSSLIKNVVLSEFCDADLASVYVKSSTGFYPTQNGQPNGATIPAIIIMLENASPLPVKAAGGVRTYEEAIEMINLGVKRIGTSAAKTIADKQAASGSY
jgi:deoxyribose-phosphate aldolase